jgi:trehalose-6-phosphatase
MPVYRGIAYRACLCGVLRPLCPPQFIGDDTTDEDAFRTLRAYRHTKAHPLALSIFVRTDDKLRPSAATHVLRDPEEVGRLIERLTRL